MDLEEVQRTHTAKRCPRCRETTLRGSVRWTEDSKCRACGYDFATAEAEEPPKSNTERARNGSVFDLELEDAD